MRSFQIGAVVALLVTLPGGGLVSPIAWGHDEPEEAASRVQEQLAHDPNNVDLLVQLATFKGQEGEHAVEAITALDRALQLDPKRSDGLLLRAELFHGLKECAKARRDLDRFVAEASPHYKAYALRAEVRLACGQDVQGAIDDLQKANELQLLPEQVVKRSQLLRQLGDLAGATANYQAALNALGPTISVLLEAIEVELQAGRPEEALALNAHLEAQHQDPLRRADLLVLAGRPEEAQAAYQAALDQANTRLAKRETTFALIEKARALVGLGRRDEAATIAAQLDPSAAQLPEYQALIAKLGQGGAEGQ
jgi:tetratricopeptide (TPR) repeat protein